jgi:hypothetical protein
MQQPEAACGYDQALPAERFDDMDFTEVETPTLH